MAWNWEQPDWPRFSWDSSKLQRSEERFLVGSGGLTGVVKYLTVQDREQITVELMSTDAATTSEIEGEIVDRASVQSSIRKQLGLAVDQRRVRPAEQGIAELTVAVYRSFAQPLTGETLFGWHQMVMKGRSDIDDIGRYRSDAEPMQIVSNSMYDPRVHFEAPPSDRVAGEMVRFIDWFNRTAPDGAQPLGGLTRAGLAHLYFETIHPFADGNGRIGRAIAEKALAQIQGQPSLTALSATILARRKSYYAALEAASHSTEVTGWLVWFAEVVLESQQRTQSRVEFLIEKTRLLDRLRGQLNERQEKALLRVLREGPDGFQGGLSAGNYATITGASPATATRDLADMVVKGALRRTGERRHARYFPAIPVEPTTAVEPA